MQKDRIFLVGHGSLSEIFSKGLAGQHLFKLDSEEGKFYLTPYIAAKELRKELDDDLISYLRGFDVAVAPGMSAYALFLEGEKEHRCCIVLVSVRDARSSRILVFRNPEDTRFQRFAHLVRLRVARGAREPVATARG